MYRTAGQLGEIPCRIEDARMWFSFAVRSMAVSKRWYIVFVIPFGTATAWRNVAVGRVR
jgi:hypothetical protein